MPAGSDAAPPTVETVADDHPAGVVFGLFGEEFRVAVVGTALRARKGAAPPLRNRLNGHLRKLRIEVVPKIRTGSLEWILR